MSTTNEPWFVTERSEALAGVLLWTAWNIVDRRRLWVCLRGSRSDAAVVLATACTAVFISIELAIFIGVVLSLLCRWRGRSATRARRRFGPTCSGAKTKGQADAVGGRPR